MKKTFATLLTGILVVATGCESFLDVNTNPNGPQSVSANLYLAVQRLLDSAIVLLKRTDGAVDQGYLGVGDKIYNGDRTEWLKLAYGMLALSLNHYSNKAASYDPARVIRLVDSSFVGNVDDPLLAYPCTSTDFADCNFWGPTRNNVTLYRQTQFVVGLMNG